MASRSDGRFLVLGNFPLNSPDGEPTIVTRNVMFAADRCSDAFGILMVVLAAAACSRDSGTFLIENVGTDTIFSAVVKTSGYSYAIGNIAPAATETLAVQTIQEGGAFMEHGLRERTTLELHGYIWSGMRDTILVRVTTHSVHSRQSLRALTRARDSLAAPRN